MELPGIELSTETGLTCDDSDFDHAKISPTAWPKPEIIECVTPSVVSSSLENGDWRCTSLFPSCVRFDMTPLDTARAFTPAHPDLANAAGVPAQLANEKYVESLARIVYYWGYPAVDIFGRTSGWQLMKEPGATMGFFPAAPKNRMGYLDDYMPPSQRKVVTPNNDTIYRVGFADLADDSVVIQTPTDVPEGHYWTIQIVDLFTAVTRQLGSASGTPGGKLLLVGPDWNGEKPEGFIDVLHSPTNLAVVFGRSFAARTPRRRRVRAPC